MHPILYPQNIWDVWSMKKGVLRKERRGGRDGWLYPGAIKGGQWSSAGSWSWGPWILWNGMLFVITVARLAETAAICSCI